MIQNIETVPGTYICHSSYVIWCILILYLVHFIPNTFSLISGAFWFETSAKSELYVSIG